MTYRRIQDQDVKGSADVSSDADLINDTKIYVTGGSPAINKTLDAAITDGDIGGGGGSGGVNYVSSNPDFEADTSGWSLYNDSAEKPVDGTGGSATCTFTRTTTSGEVLSGSGSGKFSHPGGGSKQGEGVSYDLDDFDLKGASKLHEIAFDFLYDGDQDEIAMYMIASNDGLSADFVRIEPVGNLVQSASGRFSCYFQSNNSTYEDYRLCVHVKGTGTTAWDLILESVRVGDYDKSINPTVVSDWQTLPTTGSWTNAVYNGKYKRVGDQLHAQVAVTVTATPSPAGALNLDLLEGLNLDTSKIIKGAIFDVNCGTVTLKDASTGNVAEGRLSYMTGANTFRVRYFLDDGNRENYGNLTGTSPLSLVNNDEIYITYSVPIAEWATGNDTIASTKENRIVAMAASDTVTSIASAGTEDVIFSVVEETHSGYNVSTGEYTIPESGWYSVAVILSFSVSSPAAGNASNMKVLLNGGTHKRSFIEAEGTGSGVIYTHVLPYTFYYEKDDVLKCTFNNNWGETIAFNGSSEREMFSVNRLSGHNQLIGNETVACVVSDDSGQAIDATGGNDTPTWNTVERDTNNMFDGASTITIKKAGLYFIHIKLRTATVSVSEGDSFTLFVKKNSDSAFKELCRDEINDTNTSYVFAIGGSCHTQLEVGDTIQCNSVLSTTGSTLGLGTDIARNFMEVIRVGN